MLKFIGLGLVVAGVLVALFGDRQVSSTKGLVGRIFTWPAGRAKKLKLLIGLALIYAGVMIATST